ncbi:rhodanese-like domain-containing protein [Kaistia defluvii]|uniref:rhodanese-like domain-containing protein n=1 Tax=Kaistia defluvii TaxID=410841 RepID=UPI003898E3C1
MRRPIEQGWQAPGVSRRSPVRIASSTCSGVVAAHGVIPGSIHAPYPALQENLDAGGLLHALAVAAGKRIVFYCAFGERSAMAVQAAQDVGLKTACHIEGGIDAWKKAGGPVAS